MGRSNIVHCVGGNASGDWPIALAISPQNEMLLTVEHLFWEKTAIGWKTHWAEVLCRSLDAGHTWVAAGVRACCTGL